MSAHCREELTRSAARYENTRTDDDRCGQERIGLVRGRRALEPDCSGTEAGCGMHHGRG